MGAMLVLSGLLAHMSWAAPLARQRECLTECGLPRSVCLAPNVSTAVERIVFEPEWIQRLAGAWLASAYPDLVATFDGMMLHGAMWQAMAESTGSPAEILARGLEVCGNASCAHAVGLGAFWHAAGGPCKRLQPNMSLAERVCAAYEDRGLAYLCSGGAWMAFSGMTQKPKGIEHCRETEFPAMCVLGALRCGTTKEVCDVFHDDRLGHSCAWALGAFDGNNRWQLFKRRCDQEEKKKLSCDGMGRFSQTCVQGLSWVAIGTLAQKTIGWSFCERICPLLADSADRDIKDRPCWELKACSFKPQKSYFLPLKLLDSSP